jgi:hypothetical protein
MRIASGLKHISGDLADWIKNADDSLSSAPRDSLGISFKNRFNLYVTSG